jgi:hypothetical protein
MNQPMSQGAALATERPEDEAGERLDLAVRREELLEVGGKLPPPPVISTGPEPATRHQRTEPNFSTRGVTSCISSSQRML